MNHRDFIALLGGKAARPIAARAQQPALTVIGFLGKAFSSGRSLAAWIGLVPRQHSTGGK